MAPSMTAVSLKSVGRAAKWLAKLTVGLNLVRQQECCRSAVSPSGVCAHKGGWAPVKRRTDDDLDHLDHLDHMKITYTIFRTYTSYIDHIDHMQII